MKNVYKVMGLIALIAISGLLCAACGDGTGGDIPVLMKASNNHGNPSARLSYRAVGSGPRFAVEDSGFTDYANFYSTLGDKKGDGITPSKFVLASASIQLISAGWEGEIDLTGDRMQLYDFCQEQTFDVGNVPAGTTCSVISFMFAVREVEFEWPNDLDKAEFADHFDGYYNGPDLNVNVSWNGNKVTIPGYKLMPSNIYNMFNPDTFDGLQEIYEIFYGGSGNVRLYKDTWWIDEVVPGFPHVDMSGGAVVVPFEPINVPAGSSSITFDMSWNLDNMIERYEGKTSAATDDIFILKNGWWEGLHISASVQ